MDHRYGHVGKFRCNQAHLHALLIYLTTSLELKQHADDTNLIDDLILQNDAIQAGIAYLQSERKCLRATA